MAEKEGQKVCEAVGRIACNQTEETMDVAPPHFILSCSAESQTVELSTGLSTSINLNKIILQRPISQVILILAKLTIKVDHNRC